MGIESIFGLNGTSSLNSLALLRQAFGGALNNSSLGLPVSDSLLPTSPWYTGGNQNWLWQIMNGGWGQNQYARILPRVPGYLPMPASVAQFLLNQSPNAYQAEINANIRRYGYEETWVSPEPGPPGTYLPAVQQRGYKNIVTGDIYTVASDAYGRRYFRKTTAGVGGGTSSTITDQAITTQFMYGGGTRLATFMRSKGYRLVPGETTYNLNPYAMYYLPQSGKLVFTDGGEKITVTINRGSITNITRAATVDPGPVIVNPYDLSSITAGMEAVKAQDILVSPSLGYKLSTVAKNTYDLYQNGKFIQSVTLNVLANGRLGSPPYYLIQP